MAGILDKVSRPRFEFPDLNGEEKLKELILFIAEKCADDPTFGAIKLNKIIYYSDFQFYADNGVPITGLVYQGLPKGPAPKRMKPILSQLDGEHLIIIQKEEVLVDGKQKHRHRVVPSRKANLDIFSPAEIAMVSHYIRVFWGWSADAVSDSTHGKAWEVAGQYNEIPYDAVHLSDEEVTNSDILRAKELDRELGWGQFKND